ncbi:hypothetical protein MRX96_036992 [Rhipicephalus microplus]
MKKKKAQRPPFGTDRLHNRLLCDRFVGALAKLRPILRHTRNPSRRPRGGGDFPRNQKTLTGCDRSSNIQKNINKSRDIAGLKYGSCNLASGVTSRVVSNLVNNLERHCPSASRVAKRSVVVGRRHGRTIVYAQLQCR